MTAILIKANQYSVSANKRTEYRLIKVVSSARISTKIHEGTCGNHNCIKLAAATASAIILTIHKDQYSQSIKSAVRSPRKGLIIPDKPWTLSLLKTKRPKPFMTMKRTRPPSRNARITEGPAMPIASPLPLNSPAPIAPPSANIIMWREVICFCNLFSIKMPHF